MTLSSDLITEKLETDSAVKQAARPQALHRCMYVCVCVCVCVCMYVWVFWRL